MTAHNTAQSGTRRGPRTQGRSDNSRHQMEGEIRNIAGKRKVRFRDITLSPDEVKVNVSISKYNPRILTSVNDRHVFQLSENIKRNGQLMPVWAYMSEGKYLILDGSRRKRATTDANLPLNIKLIEGDFTEKDLRRIAHALAMSEGMSFIELAAIWYKEIEDLKAEAEIEKFSELANTNYYSFSEQKQQEFLTLLISQFDWLPTSFDVATARACFKTITIG